MQTMYVHMLWGGEDEEENNVAKISFLLIQQKKNKGFVPNFILSTGGFLLQFWAL